MVNLGLKLWRRCWWNRWDRKSIMWQHSGSGWFFTLMYNVLEFKVWPPKQISFWIWNDSMMNTRYVCFYDTNCSVYYYYYLLFIHGDTSRHWGGQTSFISQLLFKCTQKCLGCWAILQSWREPYSEPLPEPRSERLSELRSELLSEPLPEPQCESLYLSCWTNRCLSHCTQKRIWCEGVRSAFHAALPVYCRHFWCELGDLGWDNHAPRNFSRDT